MSWAGPAEELVSTWEESALEGTGEEQAPEGAGEEQALEGAGEEQALEGAGEEQAQELGSKPSPHNPLTSPEAPGGSHLNTFEVTIEIILTCSALCRNLFVMTLLPFLSPFISKMLICTKILIYNRAVVW